MEDSDKYNYFSQERIRMLDMLLTKSWMDSFAEEHRIFLPNDFATL